MSRTELGAPFISLSRRKGLVPAAVLIALPLVLYAPFLLGGKVLYWGVYLLQFHPWRQLAVEQIQAGRWPLWNPYLGAGTPLAANLQTAAFYPPNVLFLLMPIERAFGWELALHAAMAGLFAYHLGRTLGLSRFGALVTGLAYGSGGYLVARWVFPSMFCAAAWLPLMLALAERLISNIQYAIPNNRGISYWIRDIGLLALVIALQLLAGHAQTSFYSALIVAAFALFRLAQQRVFPKIPIYQFTSLLLATLWGLSLAAIQLLPTAELAAWSQRAGRLTDQRFAFELSFWPWRLITLVAPDFFGNPARNEYWAYGTYWEEAAFIGVLPIMLAALALVRWWRKRPPLRRLAAIPENGPASKEGHASDPQQAASSQPSPGLTLVPLFALLSLLSIILALGEHTPLYTLIFRYVPGFGLFQAPARLLIGYALGMALLAGIGADSIRVTPGTRKALRLAAVTGLGIGMAGVFARSALPTIRPSFGNSLIRLGPTLALAAGLLLLYRRATGSKRRRTLKWQLAACGLLLADLLAFGWGFAPGVDPALYRNPVRTAGFLSDLPGRVFVAYPYAREVYDQYISLHSFGPADPAYLQGLRESLFPNLNAVHHLPAVGNYDPLEVGLYRDLWDHLEGKRENPPDFEEIHPLLNLFGARYIVTGAAQDPLPLMSIYDAGPRIYRNEDALPEAFVVHQAQVIEDPEARLDLLLDPALDPRTKVLLSQPTPAFASPPSAEKKHGEHVSVLREGPDRIKIQVSMADSGYLVLTDTYYPGWRATANGEPIEILPANHAFRAIQLGAGEHTVAFEYAPFSFRLGAWITLGAGLLMAVALLLGWFGGRRK